MLPAMFGACIYVAFESNRLHHFVLSLFWEFHGLFLEGRKIPVLRRVETAIITLVTVAIRLRWDDFTEGWENFCTKSLRIGSSTVYHVLGHAVALREKPWLVLIGSIQIADGSPHGCCSKSAHHENRCRRLRMSRMDVVSVRARKWNDENEVGVCVTKDEEWETTWEVFCGFSEALSAIFGRNLADFKFKLRWFRELCVSAEVWAVEWRCVLELWVVELKWGGEKERKSYVQRHVWNTWQNFRVFSPTFGVDFTSQ